MSSRQTNQQQHVSEAETWEKVITTLCDSNEISQDPSKLQVFDPEGKFRDEILNLVPENCRSSAFEQLINSLINQWRKQNGKAGIISNLIGQLILLGFEKTGSDIGSIISNGRNEIQVGLPARHDNTFYGRKQELEKLFKCVSQSELSQIYWCSVTGSQGIGKSLLAFNFANKFREMFNGNIIWINAKSTETMRYDFLALASHLNIHFQHLDIDRDMKIIVNECYYYFEETKCLFVFDNADISFREMSYFLPSPLYRVRFNRPFLLFTSRNIENWWYYMHMNCTNQLELKGFTSVESKEFLLGEFMTSNIDIFEQDSTDLAMELEYHPQAMKNACDMIQTIVRENKWSLNKVGSTPVQEFLTIFRKGTPEFRANLRKAKV